jgi:hypothetical protein
MTFSWWYFYLLAGYKCDVKSKKGILVANFSEFPIGNPSILVHNLCFFDFILQRYVALKFPEEKWPF